MAAYLEERRAEGRLGRLDCCMHEHCFACIDTWTRQRASTCPQCNRTAATLTRCNGEGPVADPVPIAPLDDRQPTGTDFVAAQRGLTNCGGCRAQSEDRTRPLPT